MEPARQRLRSFQRYQNINADGHLTRYTLAALGVSGTSRKAENKISKTKNAQNKALSSIAMEIVKVQNKASTTTRPKSAKAQNKALSTTAPTSAPAENKSFGNKNDQNKSKIGTVGSGLSNTIGSATSSMKSNSTASTRSQPGMSNQEQAV